MILFVCSYVQHKIRECQDLVWDILQKKNSYIFVAGNSKMMPQQVRDAFIDVCVNKGEITKEEASMFLDRMEKTNRYQTECWS